MNKWLGGIFLICLVDLPIIKLASAIDMSDYCSTNTENTPCLTKCVRSSRCGHTEDNYVSLTDEEREVVVAVHNELRQKVASGQEPTLPASEGGINVLSYDKEVEFVAGCHAKGCRFEHDALRLSATGEKMGQNLYIKSTSHLRESRKEFLENGIRKWYAEVSLLHGQGPALVDKFRAVTGIGHLTQMIWGTTTHVGCGIMHYRDAKGNRYLLTCNYKPSGNKLRNKIYERTGQCKKNDEYPNLCGDIRPLSEDTYVPPIDLSKAPEHNRIIACLILCYLVHSVVYYAVM